MMIKTTVAALFISLGALVGALHVAATMPPAPAAPEPYPLIGPAMQYAAPTPPPGSPLIGPAATLRP